MKKTYPSCNSNVTSQHSKQTFCWKSRTEIILTHGKAPLQVCQTLYSSGRLLLLLIFDLQHHLSLACTTHCNTLLNMHHIRKKPGLCSNKTVLSHINLMNIPFSIHKLTFYCQAVLSSTVTDSWSCMKCYSAGVSLIF